MIRAIITVYFPPSGVLSNVASIANQVDEVIICDNSPTSSSAELFTSCDNVRYVWFCQNRGLSQAFNSVLKDDLYNWKDDDYLLFFDQDSSISENHVANMIREFQYLRSVGYDVGCLGPVYYNTSNNKVESPKSKMYLNECSYMTASVITSSMLCTYGDLKQIGFWNEKVFLDMADWDICWRLREQGKMCCMTEVATLHHSLGNGEKKVGPIHLRISSTFREYYQLRESLYLLSQKYTPIKFRIRLLANVFVRSPIHLIFLADRKKRVKYMSMGIRDFLKKKYGALDMQ